MVTVYLKAFCFNKWHIVSHFLRPQEFDPYIYAYLIIVADAADAVSVNFSSRCKFLQI